MIKSRIARPRLAAALGVLAFSLASGVAGAVASSPYLGVPAAVPGIVQAENFDRGGERIAYHDTTAANIGGKYRLKEAVDIINSPNAGGGSVVSHFDTSEWMVYSVNVAATGYYDIEMLAASAMDGGAYHIELDGRPLTTLTTVPNTGGWNTYRWVGKRRAYLAAGRHTLTVGCEQQYFNFDSLRVTAATDASVPYGAAPVAVPGIIEAENYDRGGEGVSYHDTTPGSISGQYRGDDVDLLPSIDTAKGGYMVSYFDTGEWMVYTIEAATAGDYDLEVRASSGMDGSAYHIEIDGAAVTGRITVPNMGSGWDVFQWIGKQRVALTAGRHLLKVVSEQPWFGLDAIRLSTAAAATATATSQPGSNLLFSSGFEGTGISIPPPVDCWGTGCWQDIKGADTTGSSWPGNLWGGSSKFLLLTDPVVTTPQNIGDYTFARIEAGSGRSGGDSKALYLQITQNVNGLASQGGGPEQNQIQFLPMREPGDTYMTYWARLQPDLVQKMNNLPDGPGIDTGGTWRVFFALKTGGQVAWGGPADNGDYRLAVNILTYGGGQPYWHVRGDNVAGGGAPLVNNWSVDNRDVPVPVGTWFKFEIFWHRSGGTDGRVWAAVNGQVIADHRGPNTGAWNMPINRIMAPIVYTGAAMPAYQWVDDLQVWDGFPAPNGSNPPYAPH
jgi:hypothetical protein